LSYASEDAEAAQRICESFRAVGVEVWLDQSELRGGDAWDLRIRQQIRDCVLFVPIVSAHTAARLEGYFRLEWKLAVDRSHLMATEKPFLLPVVIDVTPQSDAHVPDRFREVQWTRLPAGQCTQAFLEHVQRLLSGEQDGSAVTPAILAPPPEKPVLARWRPIAVMFGVIVALSFLGNWLWQSTRGRQDAGAPSIAVQRSAATAPTFNPPAHSIAVLPFLDLSEKRDQEYFSDGLSEELLDLLANTPELHVTARTSSFSFKGKSDDIPAIAAKLNVANILEGSVRKSGDRLRITAQLIRAADGEHIWSETYDRELKDVFALQDEVSNRVVSALKVRLTPKSGATTSRTTRSADAYNQYLIGRNLYQKATDETDFQAAGAFRRAIQFDPNYAAAYAALALAEYYPALSAHDEAMINTAFVDADRAIALRQISRTVINRAGI
jgi:TolB-like protein